MQDKFDKLKGFFSGKFTEIEQQLQAIDIDDINQIAKLKKTFPEYPIPEILSNLKLQKQFSAKIDYAKKMLFTRKGGEQASSTTIAKYHAEKMKSYSVIADICCGIGSDLIEISRGKKRVFAVDLDETTLNFANFNCDNLGLSNINFLNISANNFAEEVQAIFIDPDRRPQQRRTKDLFEMSPTLDEISLLQKKYKNVLVKLSPMSNYEALDNDIPFSLEFVSENNTLKEILLCFGDFVEKSEKKAVILPAGVSLESHQSIGKEVMPIDKYIFEPNSAIIRAGLVEQLSAIIGYDFIHEKIALLTGDNFIDSEFGKTYSVQNTIAYNLKVLKKILKKNDVGELIIKTRGFPLSAEQFRKKFKLKGKKRQIILIVRMEKNHKILFLEEA